VVKTASPPSATALVGCGVLELARAGAPLRGVVSLHGILTAPIPAEAKTILHGDADPLAWISTAQQDVASLVKGL
jgi:hypothetical protein